jgi:uncharacterized membrane protein YfcA
MQNAIITLGAIVGIIVGGGMATYLLHKNGDLGQGVTAFLGAIPGSVAGGWIGFKLSDWRA